MRFIIFSLQFSHGISIHFTESLTNSKRFNLITAQNNDRLNFFIRNNTILLFLYPFIADKVAGEKPNIVKTFLSHRYFQSSINRS